MSEKTAEEKLRQTLEGDFSGDNEPKRSESGSRHLRRVRVKKPETSLRRIDSFMDDFERRVEQSLNITYPEKQRQHKASVPKIHKKPEPLPEPVQEIPEPLPEPVDEELPEIPVIEAEIGQEDTPLPDIPVIEPEPEEEQEQEQEQEQAPEQEQESEQEQEQEPEQEQEIKEFQEAELTEAPDIEDILELDDEILDQEPPEGEQISEQESTENADFSPSADVVVNVDEELPVNAPQKTEPDPENEAAPVSVTMPETTKTAEDKLMADIAEAMTGSPLNLESQENQGIYALPEDFFKPENNSDESPQSAEDKLKANIAQALSESPIDTAQNQANQDLEQDLNPFEEIPEPEILPEIEADPEPEETFFPEPEPVNEPEIEEPEAEPLVEPEIEEAENESLIEPEIEEAENEPLIEPEIIEDDEINDPFTIPESLLNDDEDEDEIKKQVNEPEPLTEQERLTQEVAAMSQEFDFNNDNDNNINNNEEAPQNIDMPEQILLDNDDNDEDFDASSLGELGQAAEIPDHEAEDFHAMPETVTEIITDTTSGIVQNGQNGEDEHKEKTMSIREKLASRKGGKSSENSSAKKSSSSGLLTSILLGFILIIGALILWQLMQLSDKITSFAMNSTNFDAPVNESSKQSYDYAIDFIIDPNLTDRMSQRGREGWQVVGSRRTQDSTTGQYGYEFIFMRKTPSR